MADLNEPDAVLVRRFNSLCPARAERRWKPVVGFEGLYAISDDGHVARCPREVATSDGKFRQYDVRLLPRSRVVTDGKFCGYATKLSAPQRAPRYATYASLMLEAFVGAKPSSDHVAHIVNGNYDELVIANLEWSTHKSISLKVAHGDSSASSFRRARAVDINVFVRLAKAAMCGQPINLSGEECVALWREPALRAVVEDQARRCGWRVTDKGVHVISQR